MARSEYAASDRSLVKKTSHLHWRFRVVIGLHHLGVTDMEVYARALGWISKRRGGLEQAKAKAAAFLANTLTSSNIVMRMAVEDGLTVDSAVLLRNGAKVRCSKCGSNLVEVPCHVCIANRQEGFRGCLPDSDDGTDEWLEQWICAEEPAVLASQTDADPGTREKVKVLASRFHRNELLHHPDDRRDATGYIRPWELSDNVSLNYPGMVARKELATAA